MTEMDAGLLEALRAADTPTVCNAVEVAQGRRGFARHMRGTPVASHPRAGALVGRARTARIRSIMPDGAPVGEVRARRMAYFRHMFDGPRPALAAVQDLDAGAGAAGAWWGEVHARVHSAFGLAGAVTDGLMRDLGDLPEGFPILAGGIGPSHAFVHVVDFGGEVEVMGLRVADGEWVHADRHGALVIPDDVLPGLGAALETLRRSEAIVLDAAEPGMSWEAFEAAWAGFERART